MARLVFGWAGSKPANERPGIVQGLARGVAVSPALLALREAEAALARAQVRLARLGLK